MEKEAFAHLPIKKIHTTDAKTFLIKLQKEDKHYCKYYDAMYILFHTGLRISEFVGLTVSDLDMKNKTIRVDHQLQRRSDGTKYIESTKTLQYLMGHSEISVTMDTYTHLGLEDAWNELQRLQLQFSQKELGLKLVKTA